ncbi:hypothetical protein [Sphingomonas sp. AX6]|uniref:hypothetical protein n=1 Tax=Sphingomonas sp. AX6 TaxID=2653171 RepID=UPI001358AB9C|nr:hypothetical protein [Sphingomonas sp. AX6]
MTNDSLATQAVAAGPMTAAPPSFDGQGWLFVINLTTFTAGFYLMLMFIAWQAYHIGRNRKRDGWRDPVTLWRLTGLLMATGLCLRCGAEAFNLWSWDARFPEQSARALEFKRFIDPFAWGFGMAGLALFSLSARGLVPQLRRQPFPVDMWASLPMLWRPAAVVALTFVASIGVVTFR